jgi:hypothetical protein
MIFNVSAAQLGSLTFSSGGLGYYALLSSSVAIDGGTNATLAAIAQAEGVAPAQATDEIGDPRVINGTMDIGAIAFGASQGGGGGGGHHHHHPHP